MDISALPFNLEVIAKIKTGKKLFEVFPVLNNYASFKADTLIPLPRAFELIVLLYSVGSPLVLRSDVAKLDAAEYFGYQVANSEIVDPDISNMLHGRYDWFNGMVIAYCRMQKNAKFSMLVVYQDTYYSQLSLMKDGGTDKEPIKIIIANLEALQSKIETLTSEFLNQDNNQGVKDRLFEDVENSCLGIRPEDIANKIAAGEDPVPDVHPYGDDYKFEPYGDRTKINPYNDKD